METLEKIQPSLLILKQKLEREK